MAPRTPDSVAEGDHNGLAYTGFGVVLGIALTAIWLAAIA